MSFNPDGFRDVSRADNGFGCDFCKQPSVGWVKVKLPDRSHGGLRGAEVFIVCATHMTLGTPVYPWG